MNNLSKLADDLVRRHRVSAHLEGAELVVPLDGQEIRIGKDEATEDRIAVWSEVARPAPHDMLQAARISLRYNDEHAYTRAVTLGVSTEAKCALLGRSIEASSLDSERLLSEVRDFCRHVRDAKVYFEDAATAAREEERRKAPVPSDPDEDYLRIR